VTLGYIIRISDFSEKAIRKHKLKLTHSVTHAGSINVLGRLRVPTLSQRKPESRSRYEKGHLRILTDVVFK